MTIDTTRLRADAEAVRDAGAVMRAAREHSDHALTAASADEYRKAAEAFRSAQKALYRDAPPDGIILARLMQETHKFDSRDSRCISHMRAEDESPTDGHLVWVMGHRGQARLYALVNGLLRFTYPDYAGEWPELDSAVAARLGASLFTDVAWRSNGPVENWRLT